MVMVRDDFLFFNGNGERCLFVPLTSKQSSLTININKQKIFSHHYQQQTSNHLSPLPLTSKQSSLTITINKQPIISVNGER
jgi:hypothetical protein